MKRSDLLAIALIVVALVSWFAERGGLPFVLPEPPGPRLVLVLEQDANRKQHPEFVKLIADPTIKSDLESAGHTYRLIDQESAPEAVKPLFATAESLPWLVILAGERQLYGGPVPTPKAAFMATIKEHGG